MAATPEKAQAVSGEARDTLHQSHDSKASPEFQKANRTQMVLQNWEYISLSEPRVVKTLIRTRSSVDSYYKATQYCDTLDPVVSDGRVPFDENILTTYIDLDTLIDECGLTDDEKDLVQKLMDGYTISELTEGDDPPRSTIFLLLDLAADKIVARNDERWAEAMDSAHRARCKKFVQCKNEGILKIMVET